ncbi:MAG: helix-turn-helix transcriptional regulator [Mycobacteriales bacterium]
MSRARVERLVNLTIALMAASRPLRAEEIGRLVEGYEADPQGDAFRRAFERDKEELRELGVPIAVSVGPDGQQGYRIPRRDYALPDVRLDAQEAAALGLAARLWSSATLAEASDRALHKLAAGGVEPLPPPQGLTARVDATEPAFAPMLAAVRARHPVCFRYRTAGAATTNPRRLEPWGVVSWRGRWYVVGHDRDRAATRVFRLSRVEGDVRADGPPGSVHPPEGVDLRALVAGEPTEPVGRAIVRVRPGAAHALRRDALVQQGDLLEIEFPDLERLADRLVGHGPDVTVVSPPALRAALVRRLQAVLEASG